MKLRVIMACHSRKPLSVRAVECAEGAARQANAEISFIVFDDGSTDGTAEELLVLSTSIEIIRGNGSAFWARAMAEAEATVLGKPGLSNEEYIVWLNDDVELDSVAFVSVRQLLEQEPTAVVVGSMRDPLTGQVTYAGLRRSGLHPLGFARVMPADKPLRVDTFNGNFVLVPVKIAKVLGGIDGGFSHALADIDYGLRCQRLGVPVLLAPGTHGTCAINPVPPRASAIEEWRRFIGPKGGGNYASMKRVIRKSNRFTWAVAVGATYMLWWARRAGGARRTVTATE